MPRYFFNIYDGVDVIDKEGMQLPDWQAARVQAIHYAGRVINDEAHRVALGEDWRLEVTDRHGLILLQIHFLTTNAPAVLEDEETE